MSIYDPNQAYTANNNAWYSPKSSAVPAVLQTINQFVWVNGEGTVDMWPVAAGSEMTFIDNEHMLLYVKRVDEFGHPFRTRKFKLTEIMEETKEVKAAEPAINMEELKAFLSSEIDKTVSNKLKDMFTIKTAESAGISNA